MWLSAKLDHSNTTKRVFGRVALTWNSRDEAGHYLVQDISELSLLSDDNYSVVLSIVGLVHGSLGEHFLMTMDTVDK